MGLKNEILLSVLTLGFFVTAPLAVHGKESTLTTGKKRRIEFVHGGVGKAAMKAIEKQAEDYDVQLVFTDRRERYLADVQVAIEQLDGVLEVTFTTSGPVLLLKLPDGRYRATASQPGRSDAVQSFTSRGEDRTKIIMRLPDA